MDLRYTPEQEAFRAEARAWLEAHVPSEPLPSLDNAEGFEAHRRWEHELNAATGLGDESHAPGTRRAAHGDLHSVDVEQLHGHRIPPRSDGAVPRPMRARPTRRCCGPAALS